ncbi:MAG: DEAD/DEAH box helicase [Richelia sp. RM1_1_1]|nr:DEAD/DEAH box helicase [Richelia sp. SM1_7_0]NJN11138.1 DEAD/DEAH box helicase [Richelia sp. RM1_1_1]
MTQEAKEQSESQQENHPEKVDNRLPYEPPKLRKHGKVGNATQTILVRSPRIDIRFGPGFLDLS